MKKRILLILLLSAHIVFSQENFKPADSASNWRGYSIHSHEGYLGLITVYTLETDYDTIIGEHTYTKMYRTPDISADHYFCSFRADTLENALFVIQADSTSEFLFFDFDTPLAPHDIIPLTIFHEHYWETQNFQFDGIETIYMGEEPLNVWSFNDDWGHGVYIVERIISVSFPFSYSNNFETDYYLMCYNENGVDLYGPHCPFTNEDAALLKVESNVTQETNFTIYPNPSKGDFTFNNNSEYPGILSIYNLLGETVFSSLVGVKTEISISLSHLASGTYQVNFAQENSTFNQKIILN